MLLDGRLIGWTVQRRLYGRQNVVPKLMLDRLDLSLFVEVLT